MNDLTCFPPIALGDIIKFTKSNRDKFVSYDKNGKITLGNVNEPGFYRVLSIRKREPTFNDVLVRREDYDMFSGMSCAETVRVSKKLGLSYCTAGDSTWLAWKSGFGFICLGILDASKLGFTSFRMIVPSEIQCIFAGFEGRDVNDHHYNLVDAVKEEFLRPLLRNAEQSRDLRLSGYIPLLSDVKIEELPEQLREVLCGTINVRLMKGA
jgi:hypothetical protein